MDHPTPPAYRGRYHVQQVEHGQNQESLEHLDVEAHADHQRAHEQPAQPSGFGGEYEGPGRQEHTKDQQALEIVVAARGDADRGES
jgi:hypothetical protein